MREEHPAAQNAENCWEHFWQSGSVQDYLDYRRAVAAAAEKEPTHADRNRRSGPSGTTVE